MFDKYYLVEMSAMSQFKSIRSNCIMSTKWFQRPPLEKAFDTCIESGCTVVNVLSVTRVSKKTALRLKELINKGYTTKETVKSTDASEIVKMVSSLSSEESDGDK